MCLCVQRVGGYILTLTTVKVELGDCYEQRTDQEDVRCLYRGVYD